jgi:large subunit ribosomal protein L15
VNLARLDKVFSADQTVNVDSLRQHGLVSGGAPWVKILGMGALSKKLTVEAHAFSAGAKEAIEKAGGTANLIARSRPAEKARAKRNTAKKKAAQPQPTGSG